MTHTLPLETRQAIRALFRLVYHAVKRRGMLRDVAGDAEAGELNGASIIKTHRCHPSAIEIREHVAVDVRTEEAKPLFQAPYFALTSDSCTDRSTKKEEMLYVRYPLPNHVVTHFFSLQPLEGGGAKSILRAYKAAFEQAAIPLEVWVRRLVWLCTDGANVMVGTTSGLVSLLRAPKQPTFKTLSFSILSF